MKAKVGDLVRYTDIPSMGLGLVVGRQAKSSGVFVEWLKPSRHAGGIRTLEADIMLEVINDNK
jgi:hypothetical protein